MGKPEVAAIIACSAGSVMRCCKPAETTCYCMGDLQGWTKQPNQSTARVKQNHPDFCRAS